MRVMLKETEGPKRPEGDHRLEHATDAADAADATDAADAVDTAMPRMPQMLRMLQLLLIGVMARSAEPGNRAHAFRMTFVSTRQAPSNYI